jgi:hypothetical protein
LVEVPQEELPLTPALQEGTGAETRTGTGLDIKALVKGAKSHLAFLRYVHKQGVTRTVSCDSPRRYLDQWLPLVAKHPETELIPPADVAWLWHCHRLSPLHYTNYVQDRFSMLLEPSSKHIFSCQAANDRRPNPLNLATRALWSE